ncbi:RseA family anti-sigma factor [Derxia gummosa]|uniref:RseA family anti-sigma factor n=1 Tax=Derxia gummosa DSM 723 TaxID=1121388 RepID=A0A8B6X6M8_9BURK|nr:RseA family anti-sigma factor [Derxia gummosa]
MNHDGIDREDDEKLSAFIDAELPAQEVGPLLDRLSHDDALRARWAELLRCRDAITDAAAVAGEQRRLEAGTELARRIAAAHAPSEPSRKHAPAMLALASLGVAALVGLLAWIAWTGATDQTLLLVDAASR